MSKVDQPLFGSDASGSIAKTVTFSNQYGWAIARAFLTRTDTPTPLQIYQRGRFYEALLKWKTLTEAQKAKYTQAAPEGWTGFNLYIHLHFFPSPPAFYGVAHYGSITLP
jgi:hypothetical protein